MKCTCRDAASACGACLAFGVRRISATKSDNQGGTTKVATWVQWLKCRIGWHSWVRVEWSLTGPDIRECWGCGVLTVEEEPC